LWKVRSKNEVVTAISKYVVMHLSDSLSGHPHTDISVAAHLHNLVKVGVYFPFRAKLANLVNRKDLIAFFPHFFTSVLEGGQPFLKRRGYDGLNVGAGRLKAAFP
jgi:hypothetical protein